MSYELQFGGGGYLDAELLREQLNLIDSEMTDEEDNPVPVAAPDEKFVRATVGVYIGATQVRVERHHHSRKRRKDRGGYTERLSTLLESQKTSPSHDYLDQFYPHHNHRRQPQPSRGRPLLKRIPSSRSSGKSSQRDTIARRLPVRSENTRHRQPKRDGFNDKRKNSNRVSKCGDGMKIKR